MPEDYTVPVKALFFEIDQPDFHKLINRLGELLDKVVAMGTHVVHWQTDPGLDSPLAIHRSSQYLLSLHLVEQIDAIASMVRQGLAEPCKLVLRAMIESMLGIAYMHESEVVRRGLSYHIGHIHDQIAWLRKLDPDTQEGMQFKAKMDRNFCEINLSICPEVARAEAEKYMAILSRDEFSTIEAAWQEAKKKQHRRPAWYSLFDGPRNVGELADQLRRSAWYEGLYRIWSADIHATDSLGNIIRGPKNQKGIRPIRHPEGVETISCHAISLALDAYRVIIESVVPGKRDEFLGWYVEHIRNGYQAIAREKLITVNFMGQNE